MASIYWKIIKQLIKFLVNQTWLRLSNILIIQRFLPAEFGNDVDRVNAVEPAKSSYFAVKAEIRRAIEGQGIPYTYICCNSFAGLFVANLGQRGLRVPPRDKVEILGNGHAKGVYIKTLIGTFNSCSEQSEFYIKSDFHAEKICFL
jgi:hypothetical protein